VKKSIIALAAATMVSGGFGGLASAQSHKVERGDNLWSIAREHNTSVEKIKELNGLTSNLIIPNQMLTVSSEVKYHTVQTGDTLYKLSKSYGTTVANLKAMNQLPSDTIYVGEKLVVAGGNTNVSNEVHNEASNIENRGTTTSQTAAAQPTSAPVSQSAPAPGARELTVTATAYTADCEGCSGITATGINLKANRNAKVIAVDPSVIPLGTKVHVEGYGEAIAGDTGGAIKGNKIDIHLPTTAEANNWGVRTVKVTIQN